MEVKEIAKEIVQAVYDEDNFYDAYEKVEEIILNTIMPIQLITDDDSFVRISKKKLTDGYYANGGKLTCGKQME